MSSGYKTRLTRLIFGRYRGRGTRLSVVAKIEESLLTDEEARRRQYNAAADLENNEKFRALEEKWDQVVAKLFGMPSVPAILGGDRASMRARLLELNKDLWVNLDD